MGGINALRFSYYRELFDSMKDLRAKNVFNFSRCALYEKIKKSRRFMELKAHLDKDANNKYFDLTE